MTAKKQTQRSHSNDFVFGEKRKATSKTKTKWHWNRFVCAEASFRIKASSRPTDKKWNLAVLVESLWNRVAAFGPPAENHFADSSAHHKHYRYQRLPCLLLCLMFLWVFTDLHPFILHHRQTNKRWNRIESSSPFILLIYANVISLLFHKFKFWLFYPCF